MQRYFDIYSDAPQSSREFSARNASTGPEIVRNGSSVQSTSKLINGAPELNSRGECLLIALSCFRFGMHREHARARSPREGDEVSSLRYCLF